MHLPEKLQEAIAREAEKFNWHSILQAREELTARYQQTQSKPKSYISNDAERCAYVVARMPATYAVLHRILDELKRRTLDNSLTIESLLDLGAGPGTAMWAASEIFPNLAELTLIERDPALIALGKRLAIEGEWPALQSADWKSQNMENLQVAGLYDLVVLSYSIGELPSTAISSLIETAWKLTGKFLVVIEPGTPPGFDRIKGIRAHLIDLAANIVAPCPHALACPMQGEDWCHFSERIERSSLHRRIKKGALGYEDEKYSYLVASKVPCSQTTGRLVRPPLKRSGHVILPLCAKEGLVQITVSKRTPEEYKRARKLEWGDDCSHGH